MKILIENSCGDSLEYEVLDVSRDALRRTKIDLRLDDYDELSAFIQGDLADDVWALWEGEKRSPHIPENGKGL